MIPVDRWPSGCCSTSGLECEAGFSPMSSRRSRRCDDGVETRRRDRPDELQRAFAVGVGLYSALRFLHVRGGTLGDET